MTGQQRNEERVHERRGDQVPFPDVLFVRRVFIIVLFVALAATIYMLADVLLLVFGAVLLAIILRTIAEPIGRATGLPEPGCVLAAALLIVLVLAGIGWAFGAQLTEQLGFIATQVPSVLKQLTERVRDWSGGDLMGGTTIGALLSRVLTWGTTIFGALASLVLVVFAGIYIALDPATYRHGLVKVLPPQWHGPVKETMEDANTALRRWIGAQMISMAAVGVLTGFGMWLIGVPSALALGLIAGLADFVPYIGPIVGAIPAVVLASTQGLELALLAVAVVVVVQQIEANVIMPMVAGQALSVPPATAIFAVVAIGVLFGPLGLLFGFPLAVVVDVVIRRLYVRETLHQPVEIAAEEARKHE